MPWASRRRRTDSEHKTSPDAAGCSALFGARSLLSAIVLPPRTVPARRPGETGCNGVSSEHASLARAYERLGQKHSAVRYPDAGAAPASPGAPRSVLAGVVLPHPRRPDARAGPDVDASAEAAAASRGGREDLPPTRGGLSAVALLLVAAFYAMRQWGPAAGATAAVAYYLLMWVTARHVAAQLEARQRRRNAAERATTVV